MRHFLRWLAGLLLAPLALVVIAVAGIVLWNVFDPAPSYSSLTLDDGSQHWTLADGTQLAYRHAPAAVAGMAPPVVLVHGGPGAPAAWPPALIDALTTAGHDVYDYHQIGTGLSSRLADLSEYTVARHIADLEAVRAAIGAERVVLLGTSWGAQLIANYLARYPDRASHTIVVSPGAIWAPAYTDATRLTESGRRSQGSVVSRFPRIPLAVILSHAAGPNLASLLLPDAVMDSTYQAFVEALDMRAGCSESPETSTATLRGYGYWVNAVTTRDTSRIEDPRPALAAVGGPLLVVRGTCDYIAPAVAAEYVELFPNAQMAEVEDAGHMLASERPEELARLAVSFLAR